MGPANHSAHAKAYDSSPIRARMWNQLHQSNLQCYFLLVNVLQNVFSKNCPQHESPNRSQQGKISLVKKKPSYTPRSRPVDAENAHKCLSVVPNVSHTQFPIAKTIPIKGFLLLEPNCAMPRDYAKPLQKPMSPMLLFRWRTKSLPHAPIAAKSKGRGSWLCAIEACLQISTKENNSA